MLDPRNKDKREANLSKVGTGNGCNSGPAAGGNYLARYFTGEAAGRIAPVGEGSGRKHNLDHTGCESRKSRTY
jgi:hypothetical protein